MTQWRKRVFATSSTFMIDRAHLTLLDTGIIEKNVLLLVGLLSQALDARKRLPISDITESEYVQIIDVDRDSRSLVNPLPISTVVSTFIFCELHKITVITIFVCNVGITANNSDAS